MNKLVLKIVANRWENASRDERELTVVKELGADVLVMAKGEENGIQEIVRGIPVYRMSTRPLGKYVPNGINRLIALFTWAHQAKKLKPDVISGHDLIPLLIGWLSSCLQKREKRPRLVYDSHEFTIYAGERSMLQRLCIMYLERFLIKRCAFTIEVNDLIADEVQRIHKLKKRPVVVRNIPEKWNVDPQTCQETRKKLMSTFGGKTFFLLMYHGKVMPNRGIEMLIQLVSINPNIAAIILGDGKEKYIREIKELAQEMSVTERICFYNAVPQNELWKYVGAADVGMIIVRDAWKSYYYMLPNKLFENIQSETPVICSDFPVIQKLVNKYQIGLTCDPEKPEEINQCIMKLWSDEKFYRKCKANLRVAKEELCWEKEKMVLKNTYRKLL